MPRNPQNPTKHGWPNALHPLHDHHCHRFPSDFSEWPWRFYLSVASSVESVKKCPKYKVNLEKVVFFCGGERKKQNTSETLLIDPSLVVESAVIIWHQPKQCTNLKGKSLRITIHLHCLISKKKQYAICLGFAFANKIRYGLAASWKLED